MRISETIRHEVWINAPRARVFEAITTREGLDVWWGRALNGRPEIDYVVEFEHGLGEPLRMQIVDLEPNANLTWRCLADFSDPSNPSSEWRGHELRFDLKTTEGEPALEWMAPRLGLDPSDPAALTILSFQHAGWSDDARWFGFCNSGWGMAIGTLARYCETGSRPDHA